MKKKNVMILSIFVAIVFAVHGEMKTFKCQSWNDEEANIAFPERINDLTMYSRTVSVISIIPYHTFPIPC